jgi:signal transduction histidine kinase/CheY-like chemotaxis protein
MRPWSMRSWLLALVAATALPCVAVLTWMGRTTARAAEQDAAQLAVSLAQHVALQADQAIAEARETLHSIAQKPLVRRLASDQCDPILGELQAMHAMHAIYSGLEVVDWRGRVVCTTERGAERVASHGGASWLHEVTTTRSFAVGKLEHRPSGRWTVALAGPIFDELDQVEGAVVFALDLVQFGDAMRPDANDGSRSSFFDLDGNLIADSAPDSVAMVGKNHLHRAYVARALQEPAARFVDADLRGERRIFGVAPAASGRWRVLVSLSEAQVLAPARARESAALRTGLIAILLGAVLAYWLSGKLSRPIQALAEVARGAAGGALVARVPETGPREIREAVLRFNELLERRSQAERALRGSNEQVVQLNRLLRTTWSVSQMIAREEDRTHILEGACRVLVEEGGMLAAWVGFAREDGGVTPAAVNGMTVADVSLARFDETPAGNGAFGRAIRTGVQQVIRDPSEVTYEPYRERAARYGHRSWAAFPLRERGKIVGAMAVYGGEPSAFTDDVLALMDELAREVGLALQHLDDLSERRSAEAALKQSEANLIVADRLASVGRLAAGVAHEINNPLAYVVMNTTVALEEIQRAQASAPPALKVTLTEASAALQEARAGSERVRLIVRDLKLFSRADAQTRGPVDLNKILESSLSIAWNEIRQRARLVKDFGVLPEVQGNDSRLGQVFLNLLVNAAQSIEPGAEARNEIRLTTRVAGNRVVAEVRDTGVGIPLELHKKIFEPFFTTKPAGVGTGLGLAICYSIVSELGGELSVVSAPGQGSTFRVSLPIATGAGRVIAARTVPPAQIQPRARLLVIDDEVGVGNAIRRALASEHDVVPVTSARAALELLTRGERFDAVLCDLMMPEMTGMELHAELERAHPALAQGMIVMTGGVFTTSAQQFLDRVQNQRVEKPFDVQSLRAVIRSALR